ncbi:DUF6640 family protein [Streptomyces sp. NPDC048650]|uniref:DUF6640 family protein n=1 Tax=unclassified Streptomyces TaxID=2593676 RepID=UPI00370FBE74
MEDTREPIATGDAVSIAPAGARRLQVIVVAASLYWITQLSAIFYPGTALIDDGWIPPIQPVLAGTMPALNLLAYGLERRRTERREA